MTTDGRAPCRILVVEDEPLVAMLIEEILQDLGCIVVGPATRLDPAMRLVAETALDAAILDLNIHGQAIHPVVALLNARSIPFAICSGSTPPLPEPFRDQLSLMKPFRRQALVEMVAALCSGRA